MPSPPSSDNEPGLVSQEWLTAKRLEMERSRLKASASSTEGSNPVPSSFVEFAHNWLGVTLTPAQRVLCLVAFDGAEPGDLVGEERELARELFGDVDEFPSIARDVIAVIIGARSGKTFLFALRLLHLGLIVDLSTLAAGEPGVGLIVAPDLELAEVALNYVCGAVHSNVSLEAMIVSETTEWLELQRPDGEIISIRCRAASRGGRTGRGKSLFGALLDEACFFRDSNYSINDKDVFDAIEPRIVPGGQMLVPSTPWMESGILYEIWKANWGHPHHYLAAHAKTITMMPGMAERIAKVRERDPAKAELEYDAIPMGGGAVHFFDPAALAACIDEDMPAIVTRTNHFDRGWMGLDTAFRKNPTAGVIVRASGARLEMLIVAECVEIMPPKGGRLIPSDTVKSLMARAKYHHCEAVIADQHYIETVREHVGMLRLIEAPSVPAVAYVAARDAIAEGRVRFSAAHQRLLSQLREVVSKPTAGGNISISSPTRGTAHGDEASAFVLALWKAAEPGAKALNGVAVRTEQSRNLDEYDPNERRRVLGDNSGRQVRRIRGALD